MHFLLSGDGTRNFTETHDNDGSSYSGYEFAEDLTNWMNMRYSYNVPQNIAPNNTTPVIDKKWKYVLDGVYFYRNETNASFGRATAYHNSYGVSRDSVMNIYFSSKHPLADSTVGGYAVDILLNSHTKYTEIRAGWYRYFMYKRALRLGQPDQRTGCYMEWVLLLFMSWGICTD